MKLLLERREENIKGFIRESLQERLYNAQEELEQIGQIFPSCNPFPSKSSAAKDDWY